MLAPTKLRGYKMWTQEEKDEFFNRINHSNPEMQFDKRKIFQKLNEIDSAWFEKCTCTDIDDEVYKVGIDAYNLGLMHIGNDKVHWIVLPENYLDIILLPGTSSFDLRMVIVWKENNLQYLYDIDKLTLVSCGYDEIDKKFKKDQDNRITFSVWKDGRRGLIDSRNGNEIISPT